MLSLSTAQPPAFNVNYVVVTVDGPAARFQQRQLCSKTLLTKAVKAAISEKVDGLAGRTEHLVGHLVRTLRTCRTRPVYSTVLSLSPAQPPAFNVNYVVAVAGPAACFQRQLCCYCRRRSRLLFQRQLCCRCRRPSRLVSTSTMSSLSPAQPPAFNVNCVVTVAGPAACFSTSLWPALRSAFSLQTGTAVLGRTTVKFWSAAYSVRRVRQ